METFWLELWGQQQCTKYCWLYTHTRAKAVCLFLFATCLYLLVFLEDGGSWRHSIKAKYFSRYDDLRGKIMLIFISVAFSIINKRLIKKNFPISKGNFTVLSVLHVWQQYSFCLYQHKQQKVASIGNKSKAARIVNPNDATRRGPLGKWPPAVVPHQNHVHAVYQSWALSVFFYLFNNKKWNFHFYQVNITYFCTSPI